LSFHANDERVDRAVLGELLQRLAATGQVAGVVIGLGPSLVAMLGATVPGLREFKELVGHGVKVPSTPVHIWCWLRGDDRGDLFHTTRKLERALAPVFQLRHVADAFRHALGPSGHGKDLTGYEDGTENPTGMAAEAAAVVRGQGAGMDGSSYVAVQQWVHDFDAFEALSSSAQDDCIGRRRSDNEELESAPVRAHVKRTAQESFDPPAFLLRRSMPWQMGAEAGLMFVAFGKSHDAFEAQMRRMAGCEDDITDALFLISRPVTGAHVWCPPMRDGRLDLRQIGL
jgi:putative iron-dependent peroxidase